MLKKDIREITNIPEKMIFGKEEKERFDKETKCWICEEEFENDDKVRDHCHFTGRYRGAAHNECNLNYKQEGHDGPVSLHWLIREIHSYQTLHYLGIGLKHKTPYKD